MLPPFPPFSSSSIPVAPATPSSALRFASMATAPCSFPYASAATYPPPIFPGGYTSPFPYSHGAPPAFPYAATHPYPHPSAVYAPPPGFFPAPPFGYSAYPSTATPACSFPFGFSPASASVPIPAFPSPITTQIDPNQPPPAATHVQAAPQSTTTYLSPIQEVSSPAAYQSTPSSAQPWVASSPELDFCPQQNVDITFSKAACSSVTSEVGTYLAYGASVQAAGDEHVPAKDATLHRQCELLNFQARIQGQLAQITSMVSQFAGKQSTSTHASKPEQSQHMSTEPAAPAHVAPQVLGEMPTPSSWQGTHGIVPNYCSGHHNQIQSSCVSNLSEQNLEMPQSYGFNNLKRGTVFLVDGSEHSFYMLPEDYPLERATHDPVFDVYVDDTEGCSSKYVDVFADTPGQQIYEEEAQRGEPLLTCLSKALETEHTSASVNITSDVWDFPLELQQQSDEKACNWPVLQTSGTVVTSSNQLSIEHSMRELRLLWDPGASTPLHPSKSTPSRELSYVAIDFPKVLNLCNQVGTHVLQLRDPRWNLLVVPEIRKEWDPGDLTIFSSVLNKDIFGMATTVAQQSYYSRVPPRQESRGIQFEWDPGILSLMDMMLGKTAAPNRVHSSRTPCTLVILVGQSVDLNQFCDQLLQCHFWCHTPNAFLKVQYWCLPSVLDCSYLERDQHLVCYSHMLSSTETTLPVRCMSTAATVGMQLVLKSGKVAQEGRDASVVQLPVKINCHIWDPGIDSLLFLRKLLHIHLIQLLDNTSTTTYACYFLVDARLPPSQVAAYCPSNITVGEVTLRYFVFHPNLIGSGASTASNGITSSEYVYPLDFLHDPWEFFNQQAVNKSYSEKKVLSSANYFQILEMDIIFITYLPP